MTKRTKCIQIFERHLFNILPLYSVSHEVGFNNKVIEYAWNYLDSIGRKCDFDKKSNIWSIGNDENLSKRVIVAHTDTVGVHDTHKRQQRILYNEETDVIYNASGFRPMGGDDKVGVAVALAIAEVYPEYSILLTSDEEVGCIGANHYDGPEFTFGVQCDRRGCNDLINSVFGDIASEKTTNAAKQLLPHRVVMDGMTTDVGSLVSRGKIKCAFNMSCGYYNPHEVSEYIILAEAMLACNDALTLMTSMIDEDFEDVSGEKHYKQYNRYSGNCAYYDAHSNEWITGEEEGLLTPPSLNRSILTNAMNRSSTSADDLTSLNDKLAAEANNSNPIMGNDEKGNLLVVEFVNNLPIIRIFKPSVGENLVTDTKPKALKASSTVEKRGVCFVNNHINESLVPKICDSCGDKIAQAEVFHEIKDPTLADGFIVCGDCKNTVPLHDLFSYAKSHANHLPPINSDIAKLTDEALATIT